MPRSLTARALGHAADLLDPPEPAPHLCSPIAFAERYSRNQWATARHFQLIEQACLDAIATGGRLIISVSVRHGKSLFAARWLLAWYLGRNPDKRVLLATHEADLAKAHGRFVRDVLTEHGPDVFGVHVSPKSEAANRWDFAAPHEAGGMLTVGTGGAPIGRGGDLVVIDDPIPNFKAAMSAPFRQALHEWWTGTMVSRIEPGGAVIVIAARWHEDDLSGFLLANDPDEWTELRLPAIADRTDDPLGRAVGEPLWPERYPLVELERRHRETALTLGEFVWDGQFQQDPKAKVGGTFDARKWVEMDAFPDVDDKVRGWDLAASDGTGDWTVGVLIGRLPDSRPIVLDVVRGQWASHEMRARLVATAAADGIGVRIELPQDPGQAGKDQAHQLVTLLAGYAVHTEPQTGSKEVRAAGLAAQQQAGNLVLGPGAWRATFTAELEGFPRATHDDQVDAAATAYNHLVKVPTEATATEYRRRALRGTR